MHCTPTTLLAYEYEWSCVACDYNVKKNDKMKLEKFNVKKTFVNRLKYSEKRIKSNCKN